METIDILNQLINQYTGSIGNIQTGSIVLAKELFNSIALISIGLLGLNHLLRKNIDMVDTHLDLIKWLIYLDVFYAFITNYSQVYSIAFSSIQQIGNYLGAKAAGNPVDISPSNILHIGLATGLKILGSNLTLNLFRNFLYPLVSVLCAGMIVFCFAAIGLELLLVDIGSKIILAGGIFLLAFSGLQWTRDYAERYIHTFFHIGIKFIFIYILVGVGLGLASSWSQVIAKAPIEKVLDYDLAVCLSTYVYYKLCVKLPDQAVSFLTGRISMGFDAAADVKTAVKAAVKMPAAGVALATGIAGMGKAMGMATQVAKTNLVAKGEKANVFNTGMETMKTLGAAQKVEWDKKVDETKGGKLAKNISDTIPKPKKTTRRSTKKITETDINSNG